MAIARVNGIDICYETTGDAARPALLLVMGLGAQLTQWDPAFRKRLADRGFFVIAYDNRDVGLSTKLDGKRANFTPPSKPGERFSLSGDPPYTLSDMAADGIGLLDALKIQKAHVVGASLGGMIVQRMAIEHPDRVLSLTSIMSTTGSSSVGGSTPEAGAVLITPAPSERNAYIEHSVRVGRVISGPLYNEARARELAGQRFDRSYYPQGFARQIAAAIADGDRTPKLRSIKCPTLVIHGRVDPLARLSGGEATAEAIPGAKLVVLDQMGHDLPEALWAQIIGHIAEIAAGR
jgi:pimeloyl-ACP methyl ester carboxylesterase